MAPGFRADGFSRGQGLGALGFRSMFWSKDRHLDFGFREVPGTPSRDKRRDPTSDLGGSFGAL